MIEEGSVTHWTRIKKGDIITLTDEQTISDLLGKRAQAMRGLDLTVSDVTRIKEQEGLCEWIVVDFKENMYNLSLVLLIVEDAFDIKVMFEPDDFESASRGDLVNNGVTWLFEEPQDVDDFVPAELAYKEVIESDTKEEGKVEFVTELGTKFGEIVGEQTFAQVTEYMADNNVENPECIIIELGGVTPDPDEQDNPEGGFVRFLQGCTIGTNDIELMGS